MNGSTALIKSLVTETLNTAKLDESVGKKNKNNFLYYKFFIKIYIMFDTIKIK